MPATQKAAAEAALVRVMADAMAAPRADKAGQEAWASGPHGVLLAAAQALALGEPATADAQAWAAGAGKLTAVLRGLRLVPTADGAAALLKGIGWWPPHLPVRLLRAQVALQTPRAVEVCTFHVLCNVPENVPSAMHRFATMMQVVLHSRHALLLVMRLRNAAQQEAAAAVLRTPPPDTDADSRLDLASHRVVTIDDAGTREIDDGLSVERGADGGVRLWVHIADPSRWVAPGDELDAHARFATRTLYQPTGAPLSAHRCGQTS